MNPFQRAMQPCPELVDAVQAVRLPRRALSLFSYQLGDPQAPAVILLHGLGDEADTWRFILPRLAGSRRVIALDLPGFGRSAKPKVRYSVPFFQEVLLELMDSLELSQAGLIGHSLGALIAQSTALNAPQRVTWLALVSGGLAARVQKIDPVLLAFLVPGLGEWQYNRLRKDPQAAYRSLERYYADLGGLPADQTVFLFQRVNERVWDDRQRIAFLTTVRSLARWLPAQQKDLAQRLAGFKLPTGIIWGEQDQINSIENGYALASLLPSAQLTSVPNAGHNLQQEQPEALLAALNQIMPGAG